MSVIFISYRRSDSQDVTGRIYDRLLAKFTAKQVFKDVDSIPMGISFPLHIKQMLGKARVVLVIIGPDWLDAKDEQGNPRLEHPDDYVRLEIEIALRAGVPVIPVLVSNARMPMASELPRSIHPITRRNGMAVRPDPDFNNDIARLLSELDKLEKLFAARPAKPLQVKSPTPESDTAQRPAAIPAEPSPVIQPLAAATMPPQVVKATPVAKERSRPAAKPWKTRWMTAGAGAAAVLLGIIGLLNGVSFLRDRQHTTGDFDKQQPLRQLELQQEGVLALGQHALGTELKLNDEQRKQYESLVQELQGKVQSLVKEAKAKANPEEDLPNVIKIRKEYERKIEAILTDGQKERWKEQLVKANAGAVRAKYTNTIGMEFVRVPKGKSWLGGGKGIPGDKEVEIVNDFYLGKYEVTQEEWQKVTGDSFSAFSRTGFYKVAVKDITDAELKKFPVESVSWEHAQEFLTELNKREQVSGWTYRLPKESEWEYACRGGPMTDRAESAFDYYFDKPTTVLSPKQANFEGPEKDLKRTCKVGSYEPNRLGLYDMHGNVFEWCDDKEKAANGVSKRVNRSPLSMPIAGFQEMAEHGASERVNRGGCWNHSSFLCTAAFRIAVPQSVRISELGLRVARVPVGSGGK